MTEDDGGSGYLLRFLHLAGRLKETARAGWVLRGVEAPESVADHSFRLALMALVLAPRAGEAVDRGRCVEMALVHDLAECLTGDITPLDGISAEEKRRREREAVHHLAALADEPRLVELWEEYDAAASPEARFVKELDKLETAIQATEYEAAGRAADLSVFRANADRRVTSPELRRLLDLLSSPPSS